MVHATDIAFDIRDHGMNPGQHLDRILSGAHDHRLMGAGPGVEHTIGTPAIAPAHHIVFKAIGEHLGDLIPTEVLDLLHGGKAWFVLVGFHRDHHFRLPGCAPASCSRLGSTEVGIVYLNEACELVVGISFCHGLSDLVAHGPDGPVSFDLKHPLKREHGDAALLAAHQKDHPEPLPQGGSGLMKDGARGERDLVFACLALIEVPGAVERGTGMSAARASVAIRPAEVKEVLLACLFRGKFPLKLDQTHGFLLHCNSSFLLIVTLYYSTFEELKL